MSFFKRLIPLKVQVRVSLEKPTFMENEPISGHVSVQSDEDIHADEVRLEIRILEKYHRTVLRKEGDKTVKEVESAVKELYSERVRPSGFQAIDLPVGYKGEFPFTISLPVVRPTTENGIIERKIKGVVAVKGRPDATDEIDVNVSVTPQVPSVQTVSREVIIKEVIKIPCDHCGALISIDTEKCPHCGAPFRRR